MLDFPGADAGEFGRQNVRRPLVAEHNSVFMRNLVSFHGFGEFFTHWLLGPPDTVDLDGLAKLLHHFFTTVIADNHNFNTGFLAILDPILEFVGRLFLGMESKGVVEVAQKEFNILLLQKLRGNIFKTLEFFVCSKNSHVSILAYYVKFKKIDCNNKNGYAIIKLIMKRNIMLGAVLGIGMIGILMLVVVAGSASAITYQDPTNVEFTFNPTINVSLSSSDLSISNLAPGRTAESNIITVTVSTNAGYGYYLSATTGAAGGGTSLVNSADSTYSFSNLSSNVATLSAIPDGKWGYSYSTDNGATWISGDNGSALTGYNGLPLDNDDSGATGVKLLSSDSFAGSGSVKFKIGARASSTQAAGTYTGTVNFYAVTNPKPMGFDEAYAVAGKEKLNGYYRMQDASSTICTAVDEGQVGQVVDIRDNTIYHIGKLADGKCWMLDNLSLDLTDPTTAANINATNTNATTEAVVNLLNGGSSTTGWSNTAVADVDTDFNSYTAPRINNASKDALVTSYGPASSNGYAKVGVYYNFCAASASTYCYPNNSGVDVPGTIIDASQDICPKGWRMPTGGNTGEYYTLSQKYDSTATNNNSLQYNLSTPLSGFYSDSTVSLQNYSGGWWSSTYGGYNEDMYFLLANPGFVESERDYRYFGSSMRCLIYE